MVQMRGSMSVEKLIMAFGEKGATWTEDELFKYLENPLTYMPKTKMAFAGLKDEQDRLDVIAYLKQFK